VGLIVEVIEMMVEIVEAIQLPATARPKEATLQPEVGAVLRGDTRQLVHMADKEAILQPVAVVKEVTTYRMGGENYLVLISSKAAAI